MTEKKYGMSILGSKFASSFWYEEGGKTVKVNISFDKGPKDKYATFVTRNENIQRAIEKSILFEQKCIFLMSAESIVVSAKKVAATPADEKSPAAETPAAEGEGRKDTVIFADVTTLQDAIEILRAEPYKVSARTNLKTIEALTAKAESLGISFPNLVE